MLVKFIPWKNVGTKDIASKTVTLHLEVPDDFDPSTHVNRPLHLAVAYAWEDGTKKEILLDCSLSPEGNSYFYNATHGKYAIKLDVIFPNINLLGLVLSSELSLLNHG